MGLIDMKKAKCVFFPSQNVENASIDKLGLNEFLSNIHEVESLKLLLFVG